MSSRKLKTLDIDVSGKIPELRKKIEQVDEFHKGARWMKKQSDECVGRFLRGHNGNVDDALDTMMAGSKWRWEHGMTEMMDGYDKDLSAAAVLVKGHWPAGITGRDHRGKPVVYNHLTAVDFPGLVEAVGMSALLKHMAYQTESLLEEHPNGEATLIIDLGLEGLSASLAEVRQWIQVLVPFVKKLGQMMDCYPETYARIFFCRAPKMFWATWKVTKNFLPERTLLKIKVLSHNVDPLPVLLEFIDADSIPPELGGKSRTVLGVGGRVPKGALEDDDFINNLRAHVRLMQGDFNNGRQSARYSSLRTKAEENDMQETLALELLKVQIEEVKAKGKQTDNNRGSWRFEPGMDVLDQVDDATLLNELRNENFDPAKALARLKLEAAKKEGLKLPEQDKVLSETGNDNSSDDNEGSSSKKKCMIM